MKLGSKERMIRPTVKLVLASHNGAKLREIRAILAGVAEVSSSAEVCPGHAAPEEICASLAGNSLLKAQALWHQGASKLAAYGILADDSGLEVAALDGEPGVRSARYAGDQSTDAENMAWVLHKLAERQLDLPAAVRSARMHCVLTYIQPYQTSPSRYVQVRGSVDGWISDQPYVAAITHAELAHIQLSRNAALAHTSQRYFGYDPIFMPHLSSSLLERLAAGLCTSAGGEVDPARLHAMLRGKTYGQWPPGWKNLTSHRCQAIYTLKAMLLAGEGGEAAGQE